MMRNACIVLGNSGRKEAIPYLKKALSDPSALVRLHAAWGLGQIKRPSAQEALTQHIDREEDTSVISEIEHAGNIARNPLLP